MHPLSAYAFARQDKAKVWGGCTMKPIAAAQRYRPGLAAIFPTALAANIGCNSVNAIPMDSQKTHAGAMYISPSTVKKCIEVVRGNGFKRNARRQLAEQAGYKAHTRTHFQITHFPTSG